MQSFSEGSQTPMHYTVCLWKIVLLSSMARPVILEQIKLENMLFTRLPKPAGFKPLNCFSSYIRNVTCEIQCKYEA